MQTVVYADVLVLVNVVITFLLLLSVRTFTDASSSALRLPLASFLGGAYSLLLLAPALPWWVLLPVRLLMCLTVCLSAFKIRRVKTLLRCTALYYAVSFLLAGALYALSQLTGAFLQVKNGYAYVSLSAPALIGFCMGFYALLMFFRKRVFVKNRKDRIFQLTLIDRGAEVQVKALFDSGNEVLDLYAGRPVVIVAADVFEALTGERPRDLHSSPHIAGRPFRLLPVKTLGATHLLPAFTAERLLIGTEDGDKMVVRPCVAGTESALGGRRYGALVGEKVLEESGIVL
ncbi:MAG: sigma-E processing peptidase SpoIIGA [Clostridia bacterium]|nr:sigma-E processing peptidase SpoIIGA [Clostridia bacterium]